MRGSDGGNGRRWKRHRAVINGVTDRGVAAFGPVSILRDVADVSDGATLHSYDPEK
jgi:hypothetical protein